MRDFYGAYGFRRAEDAMLCGSGWCKVASEDTGNGNKIRPQLINGKTKKVRIW